MRLRMTSSCLLSMESLLKNNLLGVITHGYAGYVSRPSKGAIYLYNLIVSFVTLPIERCMTRQRWSQMAER